MFKLTHYNGLYITCNSVYYIWMVMNMENKTINKIAFGKRIKQARESLGLTQFALAEKIDVSQNFLGDIERGIKLPSLTKLILLSNTLKVSLDTLFAESLDNVIYEPAENYYTDKQLAIMKNVIKTITDNF